MRGGEFLDTNVVLYVLSDDVRKAETAQKLLKRSPTVSVQVLNELSNVCSRKLGMQPHEVADVSSAVQTWCVVEELRTEHHMLALSVMQEHRVSYYDSLIIASALIANCSTLYSEDLHHGMKIAKRLTVRNPFA